MRHLRDRAKRIHPRQGSHLVIGNRMHTDEIDIDEALVRRLVAAQFPQWAGAPLQAVASTGTDNALYRLGNDMVVRLPRIHGAVAGLVKEARWLPLLAPSLPVPIPVPLAEGEPQDDYPWVWAVYTWLPGITPTRDGIRDADALTRDLIQFVAALHEVELTGGPPGPRGGLLEMQDAEARDALAQLEGMIDTDAATAAWNEALSVPQWSGTPVWTHGDLLPGNLLVQGSRLSGVIDWAATGVGDPACDMIVAWELLPPIAKTLFRQELGIDDATWARGRGWALSIGLIALPYYRNTNPGFAAVAHHLIQEALADHKLQA